ncbi:MAG: thermonuclease family protein [Alphaproteobacteria bacterium]
MNRWLLVFCVWVWGCAAGLAAEAGRVPAAVARVVDGDTVAVTAEPWPGWRVDTLVRLVGADAPELRARCPAERAAAIAARDFLSGRLAAGDRVILVGVKPDRYPGRVDATVITADGVDLAAALLAAGLARPYDGRTRRAGWCPAASLP